MIHRIRRVKCDEEKPSCLRCTSTGRKCDGYQSALQEGDSHEVVIIKDQTPKEDRRRYLSTPTSSAGSIVSNPGFTGDINELRGLDHFRCRTAVALSGYFETDFWDSIALRVSYSEPSVRYGVLALSTLHEAFEIAGNPDPKYGQNQHKRKLALLQYNESVRQTHQLLAKHGQKSSEIALVSCLLFISHELMQYNYYAAVGHIGMGLRMFTPHPCSTINHGLTKLFSRIVVQSMFLARTHFDISLLPKFVVPVSNYFSSLSDIRDALEGHFIAAFPFLHNARNNDSRSDKLPLQVTRSFKSSQYNELLSNIEIWHSRLQIFVRQHRPNFTPKDSTGAKVLELHYRCLKIMINNANMVNEPNPASSDFVDVLSIVKGLLHSPDTYLPSYSLDAGIVGPLFYTAALCSSPEIRWEAVTLLKHPRIPYREGLWGGTMTARMAQRLVELEEEIMSEIRTGKQDNLDSTSKWNGSGEESAFSAWSIQRPPWTSKPWAEFEMLDSAYGDNRAMMILVGAQNGKVGIRRKDVITW